VGAEERTVVVTGLGLVTALGAGVETVWRRLLAGEDATGALTRFPAEGYRVRRACQVPDGNGSERVGGLMLDVVLRAAREAVATAGLAPLARPERIGVVLGTLGSADLAGYERVVRGGGGALADRGSAAALMPSEVTARLAATLGCEGRVVTLLAACASGNHAIAVGRRLIQARHADAMVVGGADVITQTQYTHFHNLKALAPEVCQPFDRRRRGLVLGEGAGFLVLEAEAHARHRGAAILASILGTGASADAYHMTAPEPTGEGARRAIGAALADAGLPSAALDYVSAHGTGTPLNDRVEGRLLLELCPRTPASSIKSMIGHCMGAASAIEAAVCVLAIRDQVVPPTIHFAEADPDCAIDCVPNTARECRVRVALNNAFAFGGNNCIVVLGSNA
jgi:3-oxoacyl-[acyl-carrier-protein] synthase II